MRQMESSAEHGVLRGREGDLPDAADDPGHYGPVVGARLLRKAVLFGEAAELALEDDPEIAASLATLAGVTASDAVCCIRLGRRSSPRHHDASRLFAQADPRAHGAARVVEGLVRLGERRTRLTRGEARRAVTHAIQLVEYAERLAFGAEEDSLAPTRRSIPSGRGVG